ncbi:transcriptional regulator GcvA [Beggiatoa leptomitoformis]|uniref:Transcriptional regulator GcvA n=1 Tax=Beggiatoa leptomitoformis TaxID=288004 RepID=A0A2N9YAP5_9GAMM|nr:transcriptional regulator GcvA [Beggiatoa leptomitoformis]ALG69323.2 transcriptional regulator GcvA [Beggiatoa leptomitoformis]AUI67538.2 transcriptional regulator GcvA [Beggiatoa leptomitoformis]
MSRYTRQTIVSQLPIELFSSLKTPMRRLPPLNSIRAFEAAARHLSFNVAADELSVTPSAISHQIRLLEDFLGVKLFRRLNRQVILTPEGQSYLPTVSAVFEQLHTATDRIASNRTTGPLNMSVTPSFAIRWLVPRLTRFQIAYPEIEVRLVTSVEFVDFSRSDIDLMIHFEKGTDQENLYCHPLMAEELVPVCNPDYQQNFPLRHLNDLQQATLLQVSVRSDDWRLWLNAAQVDVGDPQRGPKFNTISLALEAAIAGLGVAITDRKLVTQDLKAGKLVVPFEIQLPNVYYYYIAYPKEYEANVKIMAFRDWLLSEVAAVEEESLLTIN